MSRVVVLVGMMGSGKTTVGRAVAARLGVGFIDTDDRVVARTGKSVRDIFASDGEAVFRAVESQVLLDVLDSQVDVVIAAAGGTVLSERAARGAHRPLLDGDIESRLAALDGERRALYQSVADVCIDTRGKDIEEVVHEVVVALAKEPAS
jgi:shikimate kinase